MFLKILMLVTLMGSFVSAGTGYAEVADPDEARISSIRPGDRVWVHNLCKVVKNTGPWEVVPFKEIAERDLGCPLLNDYTDVREAYQRYDKGQQDKVSRDHASRSRRVFMMLPDHVPGQLCLTQNFYCRLYKPDFPQRVCFCPSPYGYVRGMSY